jgi:glycosyltransferase involved in cell wall biosynthesis
LRERYGRESAIIRNPIHLSATIPSLRRRCFALWIGKSDDIKQPELALELARRVPDVKFVMVLNRCLEKKFHQIVADRPPNVTIIERVPIDKVERLFSQAFAFVSTSRFEGFPNTFLQAGKYAVPILSLNVDPDGFIEKNGCGIVAHGNMDRLAAGLRRLAEDFPERERLGACVKNYVAEHHDLGKNVLKLVEVLQACVNPSVAETAAGKPRGEQHSPSYEREEACVE